MFLNKMKVIILTIFFVGVVTSAFADELKCTHKKPDIPKDWLDMVDPCIKKMRDQIQEEMKAAIQYMAMGAHFSRDTVNRPGFAKFFFDAANEERQHSIKLISYLLMRGELTENVSKLLKKMIEPPILEWDSGINALRDALRLEAYVTKKIRDVIEVCEDPKLPSNNFNDYHLVDYLTGEFLEEQHKGQRELAGMISTLDKMTKDHGVLGEFLFDKKLLA